MIVTGNYFFFPNEVTFKIHKTFYYSRFFIVFKNFALSIPQKMTGRLAGYVDPVEVREIENDLQKEIQKLLENFVSRATVEKKQEDVTKPKRMGRPKKDAKKK